MIRVVENMFRREVEIGETLVSALKYDAYTYYDVIDAVDAFSAALHRSLQYRPMAYHITVFAYR